MFPGFIACFRFWNIRHPCPGNPAGGIKCQFASQEQPTDFPFQPLSPHGILCSFTRGLNGPLLCRSVTPRWPRTLQRERPAKHLQPTSLGSQNVLQSLLLHSSTGSWCLAHFPSMASSSVLFRVLWVPAWSDVLKIQRWWSCLTREMLLQCAGGTVVFPGQRAAANQELCGGGLFLSVNLPGVFLQL